MKWYEEIDAYEREYLNKISGRMNLPSLDKYASKAHLLSDIYSRICEASSLIKQAEKILNP